ncbi:MAG: hypothetical protein ACXWC4_17045 [Telluria sp.]
MERHRVGARTRIGRAWRSTSRASSEKVACTVWRPAALLICSADRPATWPDATIAPPGAASAQRVCVPPASIPRPMPLSDSNSWFNIIVRVYFLVGCRHE